MANIRLGQVDVIFKIQMNQNVSLKEINDMHLALKRFPMVSAVTMYTGDNGVYEANPYIRPKNGENSEMTRVFPAED